MTQDYNNIAPDANSARAKAIFHTIGHFLLEAGETLLTGLIAVLLYIIYVPFAIIRALFNRKDIGHFCAAVIFFVESACSRARKVE